MKKILFPLSFCTVVTLNAQSVEDTIKVKEIEAVTVKFVKPTVESKADRTVFNVANSSILAETPLGTFFA